MANIERRKGVAGTEQFRVKVRLAGHPSLSGSFRRLTDARKWAQATEAAIREGRYFKTSEAKRHTLGDLIDRYEREVLPGKGKNASNIRHHLGYWKASLGAYLLVDVTAPLIVRCRNELLVKSTVRKKPMSNAAYSGERDRRFRLIVTGCAA